MDRMMGEIFISQAEPENVSNHRAATGDCPFETARPRGSVCIALLSIMFVQTRHSKAAEAADAWERSYQGDREGKATKIRALGENPSPDAVNEIIGNQSWTRCSCSECNRDVDAVVQLGQEPDYESSTAWICRDCIKLAAAAFDG